MSHAHRSFPGNSVYMPCIGFGVKGICGILSIENRPAHRSCFSFLISSMLALRHGYENIPVWRITHYPGQGG